MTTAPDWQTRVGDVWAAEWRRTDRSLADLARHLDAAIRMVAPDTGRAVDLGSGAGATSLALAAARPRLAVYGLDLSPALVAVAARRASERGIGNASFAVGAVPAALAPGEAVDLAVSRHGVMFFDDPRAAFRGIASALAPGAPLVFSCFRTPAENDWAAALTDTLGIRPDRPAGYAPGPFAFADAAFVEALLAAAGFTDIAITPADFVYRAGAGAHAAEDALGFFTRIGPAARALAAASPADRPAMMARLRAMLSERVHAEAVDFAGAAWLVSARASR